MRTENSVLRVTPRASKSPATTARARDEQDASNRGEEQEERPPLNHGKSFQKWIDGNGTEVSIIGETHSQPALNRANVHFRLELRGHRANGQARDVAIGASGENGVYGECGKGPPELGGRS